jgi:hypothetical protein
MSPAITALYDQYAAGTFIFGEPSPANFVDELEYYFYEEYPGVVRHLDDDTYECPPLRTFSQAEIRVLYTWISSATEDVIDDSGMC